MPARFLVMLMVTGWAQVLAAETLQIEVREPAGIRRFGYPVAVVLPIPPTAPEATACALRDGERVVPAQLRRETTDDGAGRWWLDFNLSLMPHETRALKLEYGTGLATTSEPRAGLTVSEADDEFEIKNGDHIAWTVGRQQGALVKQVRVPSYEHLGSDGVTLALRGQDGARHDLGGHGKARSRLIRSGPLAVAVRDEVAVTGLPARARAVVDLTFPSSKSWLEIDLRIDDAGNTPFSASAEIDLNLDRPSADKPTLVDFGASSLVYMALEPGQAGLLRSVAGKPVGGVRAERSLGWEVLRGPNERLEPFVSSALPIPAAGSAQVTERPAPEGWAHVMDRSRCLAVALDEFGKEGDDSIQVTAEGKVVLTRRFSAGAAARPEANRRLRFWLHFVGFPPHQTAATSPQSMLAPLVVRVSVD